MQFHDFKLLLDEQFKKMSKDTNELYLTDVGKYQMWDHYLDSFPEGYNEIHKERREYDCNCCKQFIRLLNQKKEEKTARENASKIRAEKQRLLEILQKKKDESLNEKTEEELQKMIDELN